MHVDHPVHQVEAHLGERGEKEERKMTVSSLIQLSDEIAARDSLPVRNTHKTNGKDDSAVLIDIRRADAKHFVEICKRVDERKQRKRD